MLAIALTAAATDSEPAAAWWMLVYTALLNCAYHGGAPAGKIGARDARAGLRVAAPGTCRRRPGHEAAAVGGSGNVSDHVLGTVRAGERRLVLAGSSITLNATAAATCLAWAGMPMPSGLPRFGPGPLAPGVGM